MAFCRDSFKKQKNSEVCNYCSSRDCQLASQNVKKIRKQRVTMQLHHRTGTGPSFP